MNLVPFSHADEERVANYVEPAAFPVNDWAVVGTVLTEVPVPDVDIGRVRDVELPIQNL